MTKRVYGATSRSPVYSGNRRVPGLFERRLIDGSTVYEASFRLEGRMRRHRLSAQTKTDAIAEVRNLKTDSERGELHRSASCHRRSLNSPPTTSSTSAAVSATQTRDSGVPSEPSTTPATSSTYILPVLGHTRTAELTTADVVRLLDWLARYESKRRTADTPERLSPNTRTGILSTLSGLVRYGVRRGFIERNVVRDVDRDDRPGTRRVTKAALPRRN